MSVSACPEDKIFIFTVVYVAGYPLIPAHLLQSDSPLLPPPWIYWACWNMPRSWRCAFLCTRHCLHLKFSQAHLHVVSDTSVFRLRFSVTGVGWGGVVEGPSLNSSLVLYPCFVLPHHPTLPFYNLPHSVINYGLHALSPPPTLNCRLHEDPLHVTHSWVLFSPPGYWMSSF